MKNRNQKWIKLGSRNLYTLSLSAVGHMCVKKTILGKTRSWLPNYLMVRYETPLMTDFEIKNGYESNFLKLLKKNPKDIEKALHIAEQYIEKYLRVNPGKSRRDAKYLYQDFTFAMSLMYAGYFFTQIVLQKLRESCGEELFKKILEKS